MTSPGTNYDIIIIGGGIIGSSIAYFLSGNRSFKGSVLVIEKAPDYIHSSTTLSVGGIRQQFSLPENIEISKFGIHFIKNIKEYLTVNGEYPDLSFVENGYLFLASHAGKDVLQSNYNQQKELGADVALLSPESLQLRFPWLSVDDLSAGCFGLSGEGWIDPYSLLRGFIASARNQGVDYIKDEVTRISHNSETVRAVSTINGQEYGCGMVINATGRDASKIARMIGIDDFPVHSKKRQVYVFRCLESIKNCPLVIDPSGVYFRSEGRNYLCGVSPPPNNDPDSEDFDIDNSWFDDVIRPVLAKRVEIFNAIRREHTWAGHYAVNILDHNAILGPHPEIKNFIFANGFSGHGLQQSPAVGRAISELITEGKYVNIDLGRFSYNRLNSKDFIRESNIV